MISAFECGHTFLITARSLFTFSYAVWNLKIVPLESSCVYAQMDAFGRKRNWKRINATSESFENPVTEKCYIIETCWPKSFCPVKTLYSSICHNRGNRGLY